MKVQFDYKAKLKNILGKDKLIMLLLTIFICKGIFYAFVLIPPTISASPDDVGHLSYIQYLVTEKKLPVLNETGFEKQAGEKYSQTKIGQDELGIDSWIQDDEYNYNIENGRNWIIQHPPLYYTIGAAVYSFFSIFTSNTSLLILVIRCLSIIAGAITLVYMNKTLNLLSVSKIVKYIACVLAVFSPSVQYHFSTISNDSLVICASAVALYHLINFIKNDKMKSYYIMVIFCAAIIWTKYTGGLIVLAYAIVFLHHVLTTKKMKQSMLITVKGAILDSFYYCHCFALICTTMEVFL